LPGMGGLMAYWYQFALVFEALFILTTIDTGTRVARYLIQEMGGRYYAPLRNMTWWPGVIVSSGIVVGAWGYLIATGSISTIWPMFGAANQLLGTLALCIATTVLIKMRKSRYVWVTVIPMAFVGVITLTGAYEMLVLFVGKAMNTVERGQAVALYVDAALVGMVALLAVVVLADSVRQWYGYVVLKHPFTSSEVIVSNGGSAVSGRLTAGDGFHLPPGGCC
jgi:carbon starvation protein